MQCLSAMSVKPDDDDTAPLASCDKPQKPVFPCKEFGGDTQIRMVVMDLAAKWKPDQDERLHWYLFEKVEAFGHKTPCEMLQAGQEDIVMTFLFDAICKKAIHAYRRELE